MPSEDALWFIVGRVTSGTVHAACYLCRWWSDPTGTDLADDRTVAEAEALLATHCHTPEHLAKVKRAQRPVSLG
jgi:hypothetical protein